MSDVLLTQWQAGPLMTSILVLLSPHLSPKDQRTVCIHLWGPYKTLASYKTLATGITIKDCVCLYVCMCVVVSVSAPC